MAILKKSVSKPVAKTVAKAKTAPFAIGDNVAFDNEGEVMQGEVTKVDLKAETVEMNVDGDIYEVGWDILEKVEIEEEVVEEEVVEEEKPTKKMKAGASSKSAPKKGKGKGKGSSFADAFNGTEAAADVMMGFPQGQWRVKFSDYSREGEEDGPMSLYLEITGVDSDVEGTTGRIYYNLLTEDGTPHEGLSYFKRDLGKIGLEDYEIESLEDLDSQMQELVSNEIEININARPRREDASRMNLYIDGLAD